MLYVELYNEVLEWYNEKFITEVEQQTINNQMTKIENNIIKVTRNILILKYECYSSEKIFEQLLELEINSCLIENSYLSREIRYESYDPYAVDKLFEKDINEYTDIINLGFLAFKDMILKSKSTDCPYEKKKQMLLHERKILKEKEFNIYDFTKNDIYSLLLNDEN